MIEFALRRFACRGRGLERSQLLKRAIGWPIEFDFVDHIALAVSPWAQNMISRSARLLPELLGDYYRYRRGLF